MIIKQIENEALVIFITMYGAHMSKSYSLSNQRWTEYKNSKDTLP
jgi:hypothetical protein